MVDTEAERRADAGRGLAQLLTGAGLPEAVFAFGIFDGFSALIFLVSSP